MRVPLGVFTCLFCGVSLTATAASEPKVWGHVDVKGLLRAGALPAQLDRALLSTQLARTPSHTGLSERLRGDAAEVYSNCAPSVVVVRSPSGHGSGFLVHPDGWIVTNHHVVEPATPDPATGALVLDINVGRLEDGEMGPDDGAVEALVYKSVTKHDLALLKLRALPKNWRPKPIALASAPPKVGQNTISIGHPAGGVLWLLRTGIVSATAQWPGEMIHETLARLAADREDIVKGQQAQFDKVSRRIVVTSCGINPGDSGGPLLNDEGELIGVTFGIPRSEPGADVSLDKFAFGVHVDHVRALLAELPAGPELFVPDVWPAALMGGLGDEDGDGTNDACAFSLAADQPPTGILFDLDQNSGQVTFEQIVESEGADWDFELVLHPTPYGRVFYDRDNDGQLDLILLDVNQDEQTDIALERSGDTWSLGKAEATPAALDPELINDVPQRDRLRAILKKFSGT